MNEAHPRELRCPRCNKLLGKARGREFSLETVCSRCNIKVLFDVSPPALALAK
jgi:phage FluMu protein Com